jgi:hypothetical protein
MFQQQNMEPLLFMWFLYVMCDLLICSLYQGNELDAGKISFPGCVFKDSILKQEVIHGLN